MVSPYKNELGGKKFPPNFNLYGKHKRFLIKIAKFRPLEIILPDVLES